MSKNIVRARVTIRGTRPLLQHAFGPESLPLEKGEKAGVAGNDPTEWKRTCMLTKEGQLYIKPTYVFGCVRDGAKHMKKGARGTYQAVVAATLQVEESIILIDRFVKGEPSRDPTEPVYLDVCGVRNPSTKARNVRYRLACAPGWTCAFTLLWDKTVVPREIMRSILNESAILVGLGDGRSVGNGRFEVLKFEELTDAQEPPASGSLASDTPDSLGTRREEVLADSMPEAAEANGSTHRPRSKRKKGGEQDQGTSDTV